ncbi:excalibur calcium-binding domain-containing protein [Kitasatospora sp. NPDC056076]|uniref:excalibur calcium-binding domain-containing protein n=1 Tax=Kitasatospora sp. NPDC056076 TaxID=3345703 RepID=UPI0035E195C8
MGRRSAWRDEFRQIHTGIEEVLNRQNEIASETGVRLDDLLARQDDLERQQLEDRERFSAALERGEEAGSLREDVNAGGGSPWRRRAQQHHEDGAEPRRGDGGARREAKEKVVKLLKHPAALGALGMLVLVSVVAGAAGVVPPPPVRPGLPAGWPSPPAYQVPAWPQPVPPATVPVPTAVVPLGGMPVPQPTVTVTRTAQGRPAPTVTVLVTPPAPVPDGAAPRGPGGTYRDCAEVRAAGKAPLHRGEPGFNPKLDWDHDGVECTPSWSASGRK